MKKKKQLYNLILLMQIKANTAELITQISIFYFFLDQLHSLG